MIAFPKVKPAVRPVDDLLRGQRLGIMHGRDIQPVDIFRVLNAARLGAVLVGAHAVNARTGEPRTTMDVDLIGERPKKVAAELARAFPMLSVEDHPVVIRFKDDKHEAIDVIKPSSSPLFKKVLGSTEELKVEEVRITIPSLEAIIALKFASMMGPARRLADKYTDARDFVLLSKQTRKSSAPKLSYLGELVYKGGGKEILKLVDDAKAGRRLEF
jgi:hypothetical protein